MTAPTTIELLDVPFHDARAAAVRAAMDADMARRYPSPSREEGARAHAAFALSAADAVATCLALVDGEAVGHGALRWLDGDLEIKKIMVLEHARGRGLSYAVMGWLVDRARALGAPRVVLQTGWSQPESVHVYEKLGMDRVPVLPRYADYPQSICFALDL